MVVTSETYLPGKEALENSKVGSGDVSDLLSIRNSNGIKKTENGSEVDVIKQKDATVAKEVEETQKAAVNGKLSDNEPAKNRVPCQEDLVATPETPRKHPPQSPLADSQEAKSRASPVPKTEQQDSDTEEDSGSNEDDDGDGDGEETPQNIPEAPEGGWGWAVVLGTFVVYWMIPGMIRSYGAVYLEILETFPDCTAAEAGWIPALLSSISIGLAPISAVLGKLYSCRNVVFVGGLFCSMGLSLSYFANSIFYLYITFGLITGIGAGLCTTPSVIVINSYFVRKRALASGICLSGAAVGSFTLPMFVGYLVKEYSFRGTMLIMGAVILHVSASSLLYTKDGKWYTKDSKKPKKMVEPKGTASNGVAKLPQVNGGTQVTSGHRELPFLRPDLVEEKLRTRSLLMQDKMQADPLLSEKVRAQSLLGDNSLLGSKTAVGKESLPLPLKTSQHLLIRRSSRTSSFSSSARHLQMMTSSINHSLNDVSTASVYFDRGATEGPDGNESSSETLDGKPKAKISMGTRVAKQVMTFIKLCLDFSLFKYSAFTLTVLAGCGVAGGFPHVLFFAPAFAQTMGSSKMDAAILLSICSGVDLVGRISYGWFMDLQIIRRSHGLCISLAACAIGTLCIPLSTSYALLAFFTAMFGFGSGTSFMLLPVILADNHGVENLPSTYGLMRLFQGCVTMMIPPIAGLLKDTTGIYHYCFVFMGLLLAGGAIAMAFMPCALRRDAKREEQLEKSPI